VKEGITFQVPLMLLVLYAASAASLDETIRLIEQIPPSESFEEKEYEKKERFILEHLSEESAVTLLQMLSSDEHIALWPKAFHALGVLSSAYPEATTSTAVIPILERIEDAQARDGIRRTALLYCGYVALARIGGDEALRFLTARSTYRFWKHHGIPRIQEMSESETINFCIQTAASSLTFYSPASDAKQALLRLRHIPEFQNEGLRLSLAGYLDDIETERRFKARRDGFVHYGVWESSTNAGTEVGGRMSSVAEPLPVVEPTASNQTATDNSRMRWIAAVWLLALLLAVLAYLRRSLRLKSNAPGSHVKTKVKTHPT
jgi:hypothetical protein